MEAAIASIEILLEKAQADLEFVAQKLEEEFEEKFSRSGVNPIKLVARLKKIQEELPQVKAESENILAAKQDLIDTAKQSIVTNRDLLRRLQGRAGMPVVPDFEDGTYRAFSEALQEWDSQVGLHTVQRNVSANGKGLIQPQDLNLELFRSSRRGQP
ncbi:hypothetical protein KFL_001730100 [Klebsormidium nitens]|uniref:Protein FAM33A n=1 Tax=Klebsormidium nitens TaxID=105231 RepID=A0A1Y1I5M8_KLENI|nr:hypothetical protein KFL_001730100 [Klebsormidium nitens]|eukprot:GAQ84016.1 hypothetical protein KFL_001730100 [Klebsormidium nitens]